MIKEPLETKDVDRGLQFALMMQECWKEEIEQAIEKVKGDIPKRKRQRRRRWRKRGYWTPLGFVWFKRKRKWCNYKRRASNGDVSMPWRKR